MSIGRVLPCVVWCADEREVGTDGKILALACADGGPGPGGGRLALYALRSRTLVARPGLDADTCGGVSCGEFTSCAFAAIGAQSVGPLLVSGTESSHVFIHDLRRLEYEY